MTQVFGEDGKVSPATVLGVQPMAVTQVKIKEKDGYNAIQVGAGEKRAKNISKPVKGHLKDLAGEGKGFETLKEFKMDDVSNHNRGDKVSLESFVVGDHVVVSAVSKGKGFQGVVKKHGFHGGPRSHGQKHSEREPGSIGATGPQRVFKGVKMAGRMGGERVTIKGLKVLAVDPENGQVLISGAIPGRRGTLVELRSID